MPFPGDPDGSMFQGLKQSAAGKRHAQVEYLWSKRMSSLGFPLLVWHVIRGNSASVAGPNAADISAGEEVCYAHQAHSGAIQIYLSQRHVFQILQTCRGKRRNTLKAIDYICETNKWTVGSIYDLTVICDPRPAEIQLNQLTAEAHTFPHYCVPHLCAG